MEMFYAKRQNKTIIVITDMEQISPWIKAHSGTIIKNFNTIEETLNKYK